MTVILRALQKEINVLKEMSVRGLLRKLLESEADKRTIAQCFKQIDEAMKTLLVCIYIYSYFLSGSIPYLLICCIQLDITWSTERKVYEIDSEIKVCMSSHMNNPNPYD